MNAEFAGQFGHCAVALERRHRHLRLERGAVLLARLLHCLLLQFRAIWERALTSPPVSFPGTTSQRAMPSRCDPKRTRLAPGRKSPDAYSLCWASPAFAMREASMNDDRRDAPAWLAG